MPQNRSTERDKKNEEQHNGENKKKMAWEEDTWTMAAELRCKTDVRILNSHIAG
jgi:hypothetical protein